MTCWQNKHWSPATVRHWHDGGPGSPCNVEYAYHTGEIASILITRSPARRVCVTWRDGRTAEWLNAKLDVGGAYQEQFGVSVTADGRCLFVQTWDNGLHCLDASTGTCIWRSKSRRCVTSLMVGTDTLVAHQREHALLLMDLRTGEVLKEKRPARAWDFYPLSPDCFICQTTTRQWEIIRTADLETVQVIPQALFPETQGDQPWCIRDVWLEGRQLWCSAFRSASPCGTDTIDEVFPIPVQVCLPAHST